MHNPASAHKPEAGFLYILTSLPDVVSTAKLTGVGTLTGRTLSGTAYTVPTADFQSTVTAGGEQYIVSFKVTESPTGGNAVHSVDVVRVLKPEFNAQYDRNVTANGNGGPTGTSPRLESGGGEGYNGSGERSADDWNGTDPEGGPGAEGAGNVVLFRGDDLLYDEKRPNGISKSHINSVGDLVPANVDGFYKDRQVTVTEHILGGYRKGAKGNSPYTSFTNDEGIVATYGNSIIKVDLKGLIRDINAGEVRGVEVLTHEQVQALIKSDVQESEYWRELALKRAKRDKEYLIKSIIPQKYITIITNGGV